MHNNRSPHTIFVQFLSCTLLETTFIVFSLQYPGSTFWGILSLVGFICICLLFYKIISNSAISCVLFGIIVTIGVVSIASPLLPLIAPNRIVFPFSAQLQAEKSEYITQYYDGETFWLGVDFQGRDLLSRILWGTRQLYFYVILSTVATYLTGIFFGLCAGYFQGWYKRIVNIFVRLLLNIPTLIMYIVLLTALPTILSVMILSITLAMAPRVIRIVQRDTLFLSKKGFSMAAQMRGESHTYNIVHEILPNLKHLIVIDVLQRTGYILITVATLGYLGFTPANSYDDLGRILREYVIFTQSTPHITLIPVFIIIASTLSLNIVAIILRRQSRLNQKDRYAAYA